MTGDGSRPGVTRPGRRLVVAGLVPAAVALPVTLVRLLGPLGVDTVTPGVQLVGLAPLAGLVLVPALVLVAAGALRGGSRWPLLVLVPAVVVHAVWALGPLVGGGRAGVGTTGVEVRLLSVNARFGNADPETVVALVRDRAVDVLVLQELTDELAQGLRDAGLPDLLPYDVSRRSPGAEGSGTFARWPLADLGAPSTTFTTVRARVEVPGTDGVVVTNVHTWPPLPGTVDRWRADHRLLREAVAADPGPAVVAGDLNATRDHSVLRRLLTDADLVEVGDPRLWAPTWPSDQAFGPFLRLDHVLVDEEVSVPGAVEELPVPGTDHLALLATVEVGPAQGG